MGNPVYFKPIPVCLLNYLFGTEFLPVWPAALPAFSLSPGPRLGPSALSLSLSRPLSVVPLPWRVYTYLRLSDPTQYRLRNCASSRPAPKGQGLDHLVSIYSVISNRSRQWRRTALPYTKQGLSRLNWAVRTCILCDTRHAKVLRE